VKNDELWCYEVSYREWSHEYQYFITKVEYFPGYSAEDARYAAHKCHPEKAADEFIVKTTFSSWEQFLLEC
jgi:hypothetical protein